MRRVLLVAAVLLGLLVVGCSSSAEVESTVEAADSADTGDVATAAPEPSTSQGPSEPDADPASDAPAGLLSLPSDLPAEIPIADGEVVSTSGEAADDSTPGWTITIGVDGAGAFDAINADFEAAGFDAVVLFDDEFGASAVFTNEDWAVSVNIGQDGRAATGWTVGYGINPVAGF